MGSSNSSPIVPIDKAPVVVVIGGGLGGAHTINSLSKQFQPGSLRIVLVDPKEYIEIGLGAVRSIMNPEFFGSTIKTHDSWLKGAKEYGAAGGPSFVEFVVGSAVGMDTKAQTVTVKKTPKAGAVVAAAPAGDEKAGAAPAAAAADGETISIHYDYCVLASGARYDLFKATHRSVAERTAYMNSIVAYVKAAKHVTIVGGGAVGVEIAGELLDHFADDVKAKRKRVTVVQSNASVLPLGAENEREEVKANLILRGANILLNQKLVVPPELSKPKAADEKGADSKDVVLPGIIATAPRSYALTGTGAGAAGDKLDDVDLVLFAYGYTVNSEPFRSAFDASVFTSNARMKVYTNRLVQTAANGDLKSEANRRVFGIGDVAWDGNGPLGHMNEFKNPDIAGVIASNIASLMANPNVALEDLKKLEGNFTYPVLITLGPTYGIFACPWCCKCLMTGPRYTALKFDSIPARPNVVDYGGMAARNPNKRLKSDADATVTKIAAAVSVADTTADRAQFPLFHSSAAAISGGGNGWLADYLGADTCAIIISYSENWVKEYVLLHRLHPRLVNDMMQDLKSDTSDFDAANCRTIKSISALLQILTNCTGSGDADSDAVVLNATAARDARTALIGEVAVLATRFEKANVLFQRMSIVWRHALAVWLALDTASPEAVVATRAAERVYASSFQLGGHTHRINKAALAATATFGYLSPTKLVIQKRLELYRALSDIRFIDCRFNEDDEGPSADERESSATRSGGTNQVSVQFCDGLHPLEINCVMSRFHDEYGSGSRYDETHFKVESIKQRGSVFRFKHSTVDRHTCVAAFDADNDDGDDGEEEESQKKQNLRRATRSVEGWIKAGVVTVDAVAKAASKGAKKSKLKSKPTAPAVVPSAYESILLAGLRPENWVGLWLLAAACMPATNEPVWDELSKILKTKLEYKLRVACGKVEGNSEDWD